MPQAVRTTWTAIILCLVVALGQASTARGDADFWTKPSKSPASNDKNTTNWAGTQTPPAGTNVPIGAAPKPNPFKRAASAMGSAASSFGNGVKGLFTRKSKSGDLTTAPEPGATNKAPAKPLDADFHVTLAQLQERTNNFQGAEEQYRKALELNRNHLGAMLGFGRLYDKQERYPEALEWYQQATQKHPKEAAAFNDLGLCYGRLNRLPEASAALEKAVALQPTRKLYRNNLASVLVKLNRPEDAYQQLAAVHPPAVARYNIGYLLTQQNERSLAYRYFCDALTADPNLQEARQWRDLLAPSIVGQPGGAPGESEPVAGGEPLPSAMEGESAEESSAPQLVGPSLGADPISRAASPAVETPIAAAAPREANSVLPAQRQEAIGSSRYPVLPPVTAPRATSAAGALPENGTAVPVEAAPVGSQADDSEVPEGEAPLPVLEDAAAQPDRTPSPVSDRLAAPSPESIGTPSGAGTATQPPQVAREKRPKKHSYVAPSRY